MYTKKIENCAIVYNILHCFPISDLLPILLSSLEVKIANTFHSRNPATSVSAVFCIGTSTYSLPLYIP